MKIRTKLILMLTLFLIIALAASVGTAMAKAEDETSCPVQLYVGTKDNIVDSGTVTNQRFGVIVEEAGYVNIRFPDSRTELRYVNEYLLFNYSLNGIYEIFKFSPSSNPLSSTDIDLKITYDNTAPEMIDSNGISLEKIYLNQSFHMEVTDNLAGLAMVCVSVNGLEFNSYGGEVITEDGTYEFYAIDNAGNESRCIVVKDSVAPVIQILNGQQQLENNAQTNGKKIVLNALDELSGIESVFIKQSSAEDYVQHEDTSIELTQSGTYEFYAVDKSGNKSEVYTVSIDNVAPVVTLTNDGTALPNFSYLSTNLITFHINDSTATGYVYRQSTNATTTVLNGATISAEDRYTFYAIDSFNNKSNEVTVIIDRTRPSGNVFSEGVQLANGAEISTDFSYKASDSLSGISYYEIKKPNDDWERYASETIISADNFSGEYSFRCVDGAGNVSSIKTVVLIAITPTLSLNGLNENGFSNDVVVLTWEGNATASLIVNEVETEYISGTEITDEGEYRLILKNPYDFIQEWQFTIDKTPPAIVLVPEIVNGYTNDISINCDETEVVITVSLNSQQAEQYTSGTVISQDGHYTIVATDLVGNSYSVEFVIDTTAPTLHLQGVENNGKTKSNVVVDNISEQATVEVFLNDEGISYKLGDSLTELGVYKIVVTDLAGNKTIYDFEIVYSVNTAGVIFFVILTCAVVALVILFF